MKHQHVAASDQADDAPISSDRAGVALLAGRQPWNGFNR